MKDTKDARITIRLETRLLDTLEKYAELKGISTACVIRDMLERQLKWVTDAGE